MTAKTRSASISLALVALLFAFVSEAQGEARIDAAFGDGGVATQTVPNSGEAVALAEASNGAIIVAGVRNGESPICGSFYSAGFEASGSKKLDYGLGGFAFGAANCNMASTIVGWRGTSTVLGMSSLVTGCSYAQRIGPNGSPTSWPGGAVSGRTKLCFGPTQGRAGIRMYSSAVDGKSRVLIGGDSNFGSSRTAGFVFRLKIDGTPDRSFSGKGLTRSGIPGMIKLFPKGSSSNQVSTVRTTGKGKVLVSGRLRGQPMVAQLNRRGALDRSFARGGLFLRDLDGNPRCLCSGISAAVRDSHGRTIVVGSSWSRGSGGTYRDRRLLVMRLTKRGQLDRTFGQGGIVRQGGSGWEWYGPTNLVLQNNGRIVVSASFKQSNASTGWFHLVRFLPNGEIDKSFFDNGMFSAESVALEGFARDMKRDHAGRILVAGGITGGESGSPSVLRIIP